MKLSVRYAARPTYEGFREVRESGFDALDICMDSYFGRDGVFSDLSRVTDMEIQIYFTAIRQVAERAEIEICQTHSAFSGNPEEYDYDIDEIVDRQIACIKASYWLGARHCVVPPIILPGRRYDILKEETFEQNYQFYRRLRPVLNEYDLCCCLENMWATDPVHQHICPTVFSHPKEMVSMVDRLGWDRFRICLNPGHCVLTQNDPVSAISICRKYLSCIRISDNDGLRDLHAFPYTPFAPPYTSTAAPKRVEWEQIVRSLKEKDFPGALNFDCTIPGPEPLRAAGYRYLAEIGRYLLSL